MMLSQKNDVKIFVLLVKFFTKESIVLTSLECKRTRLCCACGTVSEDCRIELRQIQITKA
jgi:hypothetical protein